MQSSVYILCIDIITTNNPDKIQIFLSDIEGGTSMTTLDADQTHTSISRRMFFALVATTSLMSSQNLALSQEKQLFKLAVLTDMSSAYADLTGPGSVLAITMAAEDFGG